MKTPRSVFSIRTFLCADSNFFCLFRRKGTRLFMRIITVIMCASVVVPVVQAEHSKLNLDMSSERRELLNKIFSFNGVMAGMTHALYKDMSDKEIIKIMRKRVTDEFKDPDNAKFRNEQVFRTKVTYKNSYGYDSIKPGIYVCGEVNGKNSYGAYVGYRGYWVAFGEITMEKPASDIFFYTKLHYCSAKNTESQSWWQGWVGWWDSD